MKKTLLGIVAGGLLAAQVAFGYEPRPSVHLGERYVQAGEQRAYVLQESFSIPVLKDEWTEAVLAKKLGELEVKTDECNGGIEIDKWGFVCRVKEDVCTQSESRVKNVYLNGRIEERGSESVCVKHEKRDKTIFAVPWSEMYGVQNCGTFGEDNLCFYEKSGAKHEVDLPSEGEAVRAAQTIVDLQYILSEIKMDTKKWPAQLRVEEARAVYQRALEQLSPGDQAINEVVDAIYWDALRPSSWGEIRWHENAIYKSALYPKSWGEQPKVVDALYTLLKAKLPDSSRVLTILERRSVAIDDHSLRQKLQGWVKELREVTP